MRRRRWLIGAAAALLALAVVLATLPWWLPAAGAVMARRFGATYQGYERIGYGRFALTGVQVHRNQVTVNVSRVEADTPLLWAWRHVRHQPAPITAGDWSVVVGKSTTPPMPTPSGWLPIRAKLQRIAAKLAQWLPEATTGRGRVQWPTGEITLAAARWQNRTLSVRALRWRQLAADATLAFAASDDELKLSATDASEQAAATLESRGAVIAGAVTWWNQPAQVKAEFGPQGWVPPQAAVDAPSLALAAERLKLGTLYTTVTGHAHAEWQTDHFLADVGLHGAPLAGKQAPPLDIALRGHGDAHLFTIEALHAQLPGGIADLSAPVTLDRTGKLRESSARFTVRMDLAQQPWGGAKGIVNGDARVSSGGAQIPGIEFEVSARDLAVHDTALREAQVAGRLDWPVLRIARASVTGTAGDELHGSGGWNFRDKRVLDTAIAGEVRRATIARWVPASVHFESVVVDAKLSGPLTELATSGRVSAKALQVGAVRPTDAAVSWSGRGRQLDAFTADVTTGAAHVRADGAATASELQVRHLTFSERGAEQLRLSQPARIAWQPRLLVDALHLVGNGTSIDVALAWGEAGNVIVAAHEFPSRWVDDFIPLHGPQWTVQSVALSGSWDHGPMTYSTAGALIFPLPQDRIAAVSFSGRGDADGMSIDALHATESGNAVVNASGRLPLTVMPGRKGMVALNADGPLVFKATTVPNAAFWEQLAAMTGVELRAPQISADLSGTWAEPRGQVTFRADRAAMDPKRFARPMPSIDSVDIAVAGDADGLRLDRFTFKVEGQLVRATGRLPLNRTTWADLSRDPLAYLEHGARLRLEVPDAQVAMFSRFLPAALAPLGRFQADIRFDRGTLGGYLRLRDAASRPLGPLGVLQQVRADVDFSNHQVNLRRVTATSGGQPVVVTGSVELSGGRWSAGTLAEPKYHIALHGENLPFVRQAGLLVRGDLDLKLESPASGPPEISGKVVLRDSLFLTDVRAYLPHGATASPTRRPPYFAVDTPPLNTWTLNIDVSGTRFMRIRMPVFVGVASAHFRLGGTLGAPRAIGDAIIDQGQVLMPFASFDVKQGAVRLTEESPYEPTIFLRGTGTHFGYDLAMEVTGKASAPKITFTSTPALDSEQVLLMVMTGAAPQNEVNSSLTHRAVQIGAYFGQGLFGSLIGSGADPSRLSIESGEKISEQGKETYSIEYKLTDRWSLTGEYDEFDEYNAGMKWRLSPKKLDR